MNRDQVLTQAGELINGQRAQDYGDPSRNFADIAALWSPILGQEIHPWQVALCIAQLKIARIFKTPTHEDSWVDGIGYLALGSELAVEEAVEAAAIRAKLAPGEVVAELAQPDECAFRVGGKVKNGDYKVLPVGTIVTGANPAGEMVRLPDGRWSDGKDTWSPRSLCATRTIVLLPGDPEPLRVLDGNREVRA